MRPTCARGDLECQLGLVWPPLTAVVSETATSTYASLLALRLPRAPSVLMKSVASLLHVLKSTVDQCYYAFLLGAGCSISSGIKSATQLIKEWRPLAFIAANTDSLPRHRPISDYFLLAQALSSEYPISLDLLVSDESYLKIGANPAPGDSERPLNLLYNPPVAPTWHSCGTRIGEAFLRDPAANETIIYTGPEVTRFATLYKEWVQVQEWFDQPNEYAVLFEMLFALPSQRRAYVETEIAEALPYWGYLYLAEMMASSLFGICFTTNFDDLLSDAFSTFVPNTKPMVCAHDSLISQMRLTSKRPKIIKLHGDFLYDSIKNTESEVRSLERNMRSKFSQFSRELGLVVVGYSGNDLSIMSILAQLLRRSDTFPFGVHWCVRKDARIGPYLENLRNMPRVTLYQIDDFDCLMAELYEALNMGLPQFATDPFSVLNRPLNKCASRHDPPCLAHPLLIRHIEALHRSLEGHSEQFCAKCEMKRWKD